MFRSTSLKRSEIKNRLKQLDLEKSNGKPARLEVLRGRPVALVLTIALALAAGVGWWIESLSASPPSEISIPMAKPKLNSQQPWTSVVENLDLMRNAALEKRDINQLQLAVDKSGPAFAQDVAALETMIAQDISITGLRSRVHSAEEEFQRWSGARHFVSLRLVDTREGYSVSHGAQQVNQIPSRSRHTWRVMLARATVHDSWRIWSVESVGDFASEDFSR